MKNMNIKVAEDVVYYMDDEGLIITSLNQEASIYKVSGEFGKLAFDLFEEKMEFNDVIKDLSNEEKVQLEDFLQDLCKLKLIQI